MKVFSVYNNHLKGGVMRHNQDRQPDNLDTLNKIKKRNKLLTPEVTICHGSIKRHMYDPKHLPETNNKKNRYSISF